MPLPPSSRDAEDVIEAAVGRVAAARCVPVVIGGHHPVAEPVLRACARAHGPLGLIELIGSERAARTPASRLAEARVVEPERWMRIGARGAWRARAELSSQRRLGVMTFGVRDVRREGPAGVVEAALALAGPGPLLLSVDAGVLAPEELPGAGIVEPGGLTVRQLERVCRAVAENGELAGAVLVEVRPRLPRADDPGARAGATVVQAVLAGLAARRRAGATGRFRRPAADQAAPVRSGARSSSA